MKKLILVCALVCAGQMYGMTQMKQQEMDPALWGKSSHDKGLPDEVKYLIIMALAQSDDESLMKKDRLDISIYNIKKASLINKELNKMINLNDVKGFTKIVHILADKFRKYGPKQYTNDAENFFAKGFNTETAKKYLELAEQLKESVIFGNNIDDIENLIKQGADVNSNRLLNFALTSSTPLTFEKIQLLLKHGANPYRKNMDNTTPLETLNEKYQAGKFSDTQYEQIKTLLEDAIYGTGPKPQSIVFVEGWKMLPDNIKSLIRKAYAQSDNFDETREIIKNASLISENENLNFKEFTQIIRQLAAKFNMYPYEVAAEFETPTASEYNYLVNVIVSFPVKRYFAEFEQAIISGVDINDQPVLYQAIQYMNNFDISSKSIKFLLAQGANPYLKGSDGLTPLEYLTKNYKNAPEYEQIKTLLEDAMQKWQQ